MGSIGTSPDGKLYFKFDYQGMKCQEHTAIENTAKNRKLMRETLVRIEGEISLGIFDYFRYFPRSENARKIVSSVSTIGAVTFEKYAESWYQKKKVTWKPSSQRDFRSTLDRHLIPYFKGKLLMEITKGMIKEFRTGLGQLNGRKGNKMSHRRINTIIVILKMVLNEAVEEFDIDVRFLNIKPLKVIKTEIMPLSPEEVIAFLEHVPVKYHDYYIVRFFSGMRTSEIDGLQWKFVDFTSKKIHVREQWENRQWVSPKTKTSIRDIEMSLIVKEALLRQKARTGNGGIVFPTRSGKPLDHDDITRRIWYPTLKKAGLASRAPHHSRHTSATMWLASGESPEWVARQLGYANTGMLFKTYSKYVPNLTRKDGSAFEKFLGRKLDEREKSEIIERGNTSEK